MDVAQIQQQLREQKLDGWLFFDHHLRDPLAYRVLGFTPVRTPTRRWYYLIPAEGEPRGLEHRIERNMIGALPGEKLPYSSWTEQVDGLRRLTAGLKRIAMQYSPNCAIPYVAMVDAGTVELVRSLGVEVETSAELIQYFEARWSPAALESHLEAGRRVDKVRAEAFALIRERTRNSASLTELEVKKLIRDGFAKAGLITDHGPIVGANANASNPHYEPTEEKHAAIRPGDWVLIDMWAKLDQPEAVYYDITWTGFCGDRPSEEMCNVFETVKNARDAAIRRVTDASAAGEPLRGFQVDDACRAVIQASGYGEYFTHRTGHSIGVEVHGNGANMDNFENHDDRRLVPWTCFSIEPGIYLPHFGVRSEVNMFVGEDEARVTGEMQRAMQLL
ncbi:MAG TPA: M24 family metallopeptidase [Bryobacteraceae bacterium]|nr:M24 family metallopeptidase [Bryobacteraceae bacterium]